jgi:MFS transporter, PAT family, beta-lactamase induction signal transducer AmpG
MIENTSAKKLSGQKYPWSWVPTLYFTEGLPYIIIMTVSVIMYKKLGISNEDIALYTSWLYLPWVVKPLWSPFIDIFRTKRKWVITMQFIIAAGLAVVALVIPLPNFFFITIIVFGLLAFCSATHDIAIDGFYMLALSEDKQAFFVGIRNTFYRIAMITGQGLLIIFAGHLENILPKNSSGHVPLAWTIPFLTASVLFFLFFIYHKFILPKPADDKPAKSVQSKTIFEEFIKSFKKFFEKDKILIILGFLLFYRLGESQLVKLSPVFMLDSRTAGGLGLSTSDVGFIYGTIGIIALIIGGILGGILIARFGLKKMLWVMVAAINVPDLVYVYMSFTQPENISIVYLCVAVEQFGYGLGFTAYTMYMIYIAAGEFKTSHFALATGFMALGMMIPSMFSGMIQSTIGYKYFFIWVCIATIPSFIIAKYVPLDENSGIKKIEVGK